ncbi:hypothetical protein L195_g037925 [Trifolium pratense]|uniref:Uncharacterized protein n=1 Tax=Trifolium pratense TaxID=57577 RepID=A0A2K3LTN6_TRIPR|nr:hypothetical protein L195_g037925 [Trifolium pratense]
MRCVSSKETTLSKATKFLSSFLSADNGAPVHIDRCLHKAYKAFKKLNKIHKERKSRQSHATDDSGRVVGSVDVKYENEVPREQLQDENVDEKLIRNGNGSVSGGSEKHDKKDSKDKLEFGNTEGDGKLPKKEESGIESGKGIEGGTEEVKKQKREKKKKDKNQEGENAMGQEQKEEVEKKLSDGVKSENGGLVDHRDIEIRSKEKHEAGSENKLKDEEVKTDQKKKRKNKDVEDRSGERSKKKTKRKHEG